MRREIGLIELEPDGVWKDDGKWVSASGGRRKFAP